MHCIALHCNDTLRVPVNHAGLKQTNLSRFFSETEFAQYFYFLAKCPAEMNICTNENFSSTTRPYYFRPYIARQKSLQLLTWFNNTTKKCSPLPVFNRELFWSFQKTKQLAGRCFVSIACWCFLRQMVLILPISSNVLAKLAWELLR